MWDFLQLENVLQLQVSEVLKLNSMLKCLKYSIYGVLYSVYCNIMEKISNIQEIFNLRLNTHLFSKIFKLFLCASHVFLEQHCTVPVFLKMLDKLRTALKNALSLYPETYIGSSFSWNFELSNQIPGSVLSFAVITGGH